jgi:HEAT repeat protein
VTFKQKRWLLAAIVSLVAAAGWYLLQGPREPEYEGRPVSYWFKEYCRSGQHMIWDDSRRAEATAALHQMGTNAVPYLLEQAFNTRPDSAFRKQVYRVLNGLPRSWGLPVLVSPDILRGESGFALEKVKPPASQLLPLLKPHLNSTNSLEHRQALFILGTTGEGAEQAVPWLCAALKSPDQWARVLAVQSLGWIGPKAQAAVPALIEVLQAPQGMNRLGTSAAHALGAIGSNAAPALPLVRDLFAQETNWNPRCTIAAALCQIDAGQTEALAFLTNGLRSYEPASERWIAASQLGKIGPNAKAAVPVLSEALDGTNDMLFSQVPGALKAIGVPTAEFLPRMKKQLQSGNQTTRANAAARVLDIDPADHDAHLVLMDLVKKGTFLQGFAIEALGRAGPAAGEAVPVLREVAKTRSRDREAALKALKRIESIPRAKQSRLFRTERRRMPPSLRATH